MAKILVLLACSVIMLHAFVPHHHHNFEAGGGLFFDAGMGCQCDGGCHHPGSDCHHHTHHPFDICLIQEMLSHLIISTGDDQWSLSELIVAEANNFVMLDFCNVQFDFSGLAVVGLPFRWLPEVVRISIGPMLGATLLRAPPMVS